MSDDRVRVKDPVSGHEFTTTVDHVAGAPELQVLKGRPAVDQFGDNLPPKLRVPTKGAEPEKEN